MRRRGTKLLHPEVLEAYQKELGRWPGLSKRQVFLRFSEETWNIIKKHGHYYEETRGWNNYRNLTRLT